MNKPFFSLRGKLVCLIGGTGLIGQSIKNALCDMGAGVIVGSRHPLAAYKVRRKNLHYKKVDISQEKSIEDFIKEVVAQYKRIDAWINCAWPRYDYKDVSVEKIDSDVMLKEIEGHLLGYFNCCGYALRQMKKQRKGSIVNLGSIYGEVAPDFRIYKGTEIRNIPTYSLVKSGIHILSKYFSILGSEYNIRVNTVAPGGVYDKQSSLFKKRYSERVPLKRMARPSEIAGPVVFLASDASSYITGQTLFVDGGLTAW